MSARRDPGAGAGALPFFMPAEPGERYCLFHPPAPGVPPRGAMLYIHPFGEEMNKSRRMAALQARAFAAGGYGVLQIDLYGCGDSGGDFADARWDIWQRDLVLACAWLLKRVPGPLTLWGLRLGALLAVDLAGQAPSLVQRLILWHPALDGTSYLDQFLRLRLAGRMVADGAPGALPAGAATTPPPAPAARAELARGEAVEIGGYQLSPALADAIDARDGVARPLGAPVHWFALTAASGGVGPTTARQAERWRQAGTALYLHGVTGVPFWASSEITQCQALLSSTAALCP